MSEEAKPVCWDCQQPITDEFPGVSRTHTTEGVCKRALRAALDQEREKVERLQLAAGDAIHYLEKARIWGGMGWHWNHLRKELAEKAHALLSGRGEGGNDG